MLTSNSHSFKTNFIPNWKGENPHVFDLGSYGFNGQEKDDEILEGVCSAECWQYDNIKQWGQRPCSGMTN